MGVDLCRYDRSQNDRGGSAVGRRVRRHPQRPPPLAASLLSGVWTVLFLSGPDSDPDRVGHADGQPVVDHEFLNRERALPVEDLEQLRH